MSFPHAKVYAMDTFFYNCCRVYPLEAQCEILAELGYDGTYLTLWGDDAWNKLKHIPTLALKNNLHLAGVWTMLDIAKPDAAMEKIQRTLDCSEGECPLEIALHWQGHEPLSDPVGDTLALTLLERLLKAAETRKTEIILYPHSYWWMERISDAVRLINTLRHPALKLNFPSFHWYVVEVLKHGNINLEESINLSAPYLRYASFAGSRSAADYKQAVNIPYAEGELDHFYVLALLRKAGFTGNIGFNGYALGGDPYPKLANALSNLRDLEKRVASHPNWMLSK